MQRTVKIFDTTLRDGEQAPGCSMNLAEKLEIAQQLELLGVDIIEAGFAVSSPDDFGSVQAIAAALKNCCVASLSRAVEKDIDASRDALKGAVSPRIHLFIATSQIHMEHKLKMSPQEVLDRTAAAVSYAAKFCSDIEFSAEDATRSDREFLARVIETAITAGATTVNIPDTVGYTSPDEMGSLITYLKNNVPNIDRAAISVHCHNDLGLAVANTLAGIAAGATQAECTVNGIGERAGNAAMDEIVMALNTRKGLYSCQTNINTTHIYRTGKLVSSIIGQPIPINKPIVGNNAFLHESGIHQHGVLAEKTTYEIMSPEAIGKVHRPIVLGKHSGRHAFEARLTELGYSFTKEQVDAHFIKFKEICDRKKNITDNDLEAIIANREQAGSVYKLETFSVHSAKGSMATCVVSLNKDGAVLQDVSLGDGPVDAAYNAIDKIAGIEGCELETYSINSTSDGKDSLGEVLVRLRRGDTLISGRGLSTDIIESSILAYLSAVNKLVNIA